MRRLQLILAILSTTGGNLLSQDYHAIHGSSFAGSLGVGNNPASIVTCPFPWDINVFSAQVTTSSNVYTVLNYSLLSSPTASQYIINRGNYGRYSASNANTHLLNARFAINREEAFAFGLNMRGYEHVKTGPYNFIDSIKSLKSFLRLNESNLIFEGDAKTSTWIELFGTYSRTLLDNDANRLNAGITVKVTKGISGAYARLQNIGFEKNAQNNPTDYSLKSGTASYGYSSNYDEWKTNQGTGVNVKNFVANSRASVSFDVGFEYLVKTQDITGFYDDDTYLDYDWKIAVAFLDIGSNNYQYSSQSRSVNGLKTGVPDGTLGKKFGAIRSMAAFNDSVATIVNSLVPLTGNFKIINPARMVVNVDKYLSGDFYLNGELSLNLFSLAGYNKLYVKELNLITVTPRWETRRLGVYLPIQFNTQSQFWMGAAFKVGPLLIGVHNLGYIFAKNMLQNGGGYLALVIRPGSHTKAFYDKRNDCPR